LIGTDGLIEVKCPKSVTHLLTFRRGIASNYLLQVQGELLATGRQWCDFVSYDPRNLKHPLYIERIQRDEGLIGNIRAAVLTFWQVFDELKNSL
jgi:hypothetical protein